MKNENKHLLGSAMAGVGLAAGFWAAVISGINAQANTDKQNGVAECDGYLRSAIGAVNKLHIENEAVASALIYDTRPGVEAKFKAYSEKKGAFDKEFTDKVQQWKACVARKQQKNVPVAVQPKQVSRANNTLLLFR